MKVRMIVSTCLTTNPSEDQTWTEWDEDFNRVHVRKPRCEMDHIFSTIQPGTDVHNRIRQKTIALEKAWLCKRWEHRMDATALGFIATDAYLAFAKLTPQGQIKYPCGKSGGGGDGRGNRNGPLQFMRNLGLQLLLNTWRTDKHKERVAKAQSGWLARTVAVTANVNASAGGTGLLSSSNFLAPGSAAATAGIVKASPASSHGKTLSYARFAHLRMEFTGGKQRWCKICKLKKTSRFCGDCGFDVPICNPRVRPTCISTHKFNPSFRGTASREFSRNQTRKRKRLAASLRGTPVAGKIVKTTTTTSVEVTTSPSAAATVPATARAARPAPLASNPTSNITRPVPLASNPASNMPRPAPLTSNPTSNIPRPAAPEAARAAPEAAPAAAPEAARAAAPTSPPP